MIGLFNKSVTVLNREPLADGSDKYYPTFINNVCLQIHNTSNNNVTNSNVSSKCLLIVKKLMLPKPYLNPKEWCSANNKSNNITFKTDDYIVAGAINESNITDISAINDKYDYVFKINSVAYFQLTDSFQIKTL